MGASSPAPVRGTVPPIETLTAGKLMNSRVFLALMIAALATACARPGRELKAPCGPISSYAANDECGELKPANSAFDKVVSQ